MARTQRLLSEMTHPLFLFLDVMGMAACLSTVYLPAAWQALPITLGSALLTIGITLPAATFFQSLQNEQAFKILSSCNLAGIESIFLSRKHDAADLRAALTSAIVQTNSIRLLGVAFRSFFDPSGESREGLSHSLNSPATSLRVLVLDPASDSARRRDEAEKSGATIDDIIHTMNHGLYAVVFERLRHIRSMAQDWSVLAANRQLLRDRLNMAVRTYETEPTVLAMVFDHTLFAEQYHRGRPTELVPTGSCIGKYMPMVQFRRGSRGYRFLECHFDQVWSETEQKDVTDALVDRALKSLPP